MILLKFYIVFVLINFSGGTKSILSNLIYIPISLSAIIFNIYGGIISGFLGGILLCLIPLNIDNSLSQPLSDRLFRLIFLSCFGYFLGIVFKIMENKNKKLEKISNYNSITSLPNRILLVDNLNKLILKEKKFSIVAIYIENLKEVINTVGLSKSRLLLNSISDYIKKIQYEINIEIYNSYSLNFEILLLDYDSKQVISWVNHVKNRLTSEKFIINGEEMPLDFYLGIVTSSEQLKTSDDYLDKAYEAIDYAYSHSLKTYIYMKEEHHLSHIFLASKIYSALKNNHFHLVYQPKYSIVEDRIYGVEALIRWTDPVIGNISPNEFIPKIEKTNVINKITNFVIDSVIHDIKYLKSNNINLSFSINITPRDLYVRSHCEYLIKKLKINKIDPSTIELEITETDLIKNIELVKKNLNMLQSHGIKISLDDFGSGYSSLSYLESLPLNCVKLDKSLIKNILEDWKKRLLIKNILELSKNFENEAVIEGVESSEELKVLKEIGCDKIQGYFISKPLSLNNLLELLKI